VESGERTVESEGKKNKMKSPAKPETPSTTHSPPSTKEIGGRGGADPTRFGDWEINGKCVDF